MDDTFRKLQGMCRDALDSYQPGLQEISGANGNTTPGGMQLHTTTNKSWFGSESHVIIHAEEVVQHGNEHLCRQYPVDDNG